MAGQPTPSDKDLPTREWILKLPKSDLHRHLGGSLRLQTLIDLSREYKVPLPTTDPAELRKLLVKDAACPSLEEYIKAHKVTESVLVTPDALERAAYEACEDAAKDAVKLLEIRFGPTNYEKHGMKLHAIVEAVLRGIKRGGLDHGVETGLLICGIRSDKDATRRAAELAVNYRRNGVVGFDLAGKEKGNGPKDFRDIFKPVHDSFLPVTVHAGEEYNSRSIADAILYLNAERIGHGITLREDGELIDLVNRRRIGIEACVKSNLGTNSVSSYQAHPVKAYYDAGMRVSVNTDNPLMADTTVTDELYRLGQEFGFTNADIKRLIKNGYKSTFIEPAKTKQRLAWLDGEFAKGG
jgi:adenosine deaminase